MYRTPYGNDVSVLWRINEAGPNGTSAPYDLTGKDLSVEIKNGMKTLSVAELTTDGNLLSFIYYGKDQKGPSKPEFTLWENRGKAGQRRLDHVGVLELVEHSFQAGGCSDCSHVEIQTLQLFSVISTLSESAVPETIARKAWVEGKLADYYTKSAADARYLQELSFEGLKNKPTTLAGFGITDAKIQGGTVVLGNKSITPLTEHQSLDHLETKEEARNKVDKIVGKGLSTNDYTDAEKEKLEGIEAGAQKNVKPDWNAPVGAAQILNKPDLSGFITTAVEDLINYYKKSETYTKDEVQQMLAAIKQFSYEVVASLPEAGAGTMHKIYLTPAIKTADRNIKEEYITVLEAGAYRWEHLGDTNIDLSGYSTTAQMNAAISNALAAYVTSEMLGQVLSSYYDKTATDAAIKNEADRAKEVENALGLRIGDVETAMAGKASVASLGEVKERTSALEESIEELLLGSHDHMAAAWAEDQASPAAVKSAGDPSLVNFDFQVIDHKRNTDERSEPVGQTLRNNILRFKDGHFAPAVGITAAQAAECMENDLYLDGTLYAAAGSYDPAAFYADHCTWEAGQDDVVRLTHPVLRKGSAQGDEVGWYLMPWETTSKDYSFMLGFQHTLHYLQNVKGMSGRVWNFISTEPKSWDGLEAVKVAPSAFSPSPVAVITDEGLRKSRCAFYAYDGESAVNGNGGAGDSGGLSTLLQNTGKTFPASSVMSQITTMQYARNNNSDPTRNYPFAEGGWALYNLFVTWLEIKYGTRAIHASGRFQSGISSNDSCSNEANWRSNGGVRCRPQGGDSWEYRGWGSASAILKKNANGDAPSNWSAFLNNYRPKEACMESQLAASFAVEAGVRAGVEFEMYGEIYTWAAVPDTDDLEHGHMNAVIRSIRRGTIDAFDASGNATTFDVEFCLRMSLFEGANLSGDIFRYWGGGLEIIGTVVGTESGRSGDPVDIFFEPDQKKWVTDTEYSHADGSKFVAEDHHEKLAEAVSLGNGYTLADSPMTPWPVKKGGALTQGMCHYGYCAVYWGNTLGARVRVGVRFSGYAHHGSCSPRNLYADYTAGSTNTSFGGSAQVLIGESAAAPQAQ